MSDSGDDKQGKRPPAEAAADDPWAKWRQPEAPTAAASERPRPAPREKRPVAAKAAVAPAEPVELQLPTGTLSPIRKKAEPTRAAAKKPYAKPAASGIQRIHEQSRGNKVRDAKQPRPATAAPVTPRDPETVPTGVRLSKVMSERGMCSRREADLWIERGWVFVNGEQIAELGSRIEPDAEISISKEAEKDQAKQVTILLNKPVGYVSGQPEADCKPAVTLISAETWVRQPGDQEFKPWMLRGLAPAGRLDIDSTGLLVFTQDGRIAKKLVGEDGQTEKEYLVRVNGEMIPNGLELLRHGLELEGKPLKPAWVKQLNEDQLHFILKEGKKRQIRRMCEMVGLRVIGLKRVRIGKIRLGDLPLGHWRFLRADESF
ncbi:MAG: pseudouridylate synthase [Betaproteobacteria bacterium HGW-Betaproteobacteria-7]|jgi:23S rRNA pseudouridine2604 synthase|nr:MAG: pseudouridylate synthase [Betaproteobacteria bacterium HGW-Betaproteobacteria-7]